MKIQKKIIGFDKEKDVVIIFYSMYEFTNFIKVLQSINFRYAGSLSGLCDGVEKVLKTDAVCFRLSTGRYGSLSYFQENDLCPYNGHLEYYRFDYFKNNPYNFSLLVKEYLEKYPDRIKT